MNDRKIMNILTFDIEEWYIERTLHGGRAEKYRQFDEMLDRLLALLDERGLKATCFCLGKLAEERPDVVRRLHEAGHEIGCHSNIHTWLNKLSREEALADTRAAVDALEQCIGQKVKSYRAPAFSVGESNPWAFEVLAECGIERDASVFPASRDFGGFASYGTSEPAIVTYNGHSVKEFPVSTVSVFGKQMVCTGGGYFRLFPWWFIRSKVANSDYTMCYFHLADLIQEDHKMLSREEYERYFKEKGTLFNRTKRYIKSNLGTSGAFSKLERLLAEQRFVNLETADQQMNWPEKKRIVLGPEA